MKPRIAYIINSLEGGGAAGPIPGIVEVLTGSGAEVKVLALTMRNGKALPPIRDAGIDVTVRQGGEKDHRAALSWLIAELSARGATHIWTSLTRAALLGQIAGSRLRIPVASWQLNAFLKPWNERLLRLRRNRSQLWIADSQSVAELTVSRLRVDPDRLLTWTVFVADPEAAVARPFSPGETLRLGILGRLHENKAYDILIAALAMLRQQGFTPPVPFEITIAGEGGDRDRLQALASSASINNISWPGFSTDPRAFLTGLHLYLQASRREGFCIAAHEAMEAGLPVIVSRTGEMPITVEALRNGRVVTPGDPVTLAEALRGMLSAPDALYEMGRAGRAGLIERYSKERFQDTGRAVLDRLCQIRV